MGWVVFEESTGRAQKYYKKESTAKRICTQHNRGFKDKGFGVTWSYDKHWIYSSYAAYEGVLMGMQEPERKMWAFCRG